MTASIRERREIGEFITDGSDGASLMARGIPVEITGFGGYSYGF
jgi:hypothetical protein